MSPDHDSSYKLLFSHPKMVEDLLRGFVREEWIDDVDFPTLERVSGSFVNDGLCDRESDIIWRVRLRDRWLYIYLLLEFQSTVDPLMAVRMLTYVGLLYQELGRKQERYEGRLPPVLPVVLYNGIPRWTAATEVAELVTEMRGGLARYCPQMRYLLLDEGALDESDQLAVRNLAAALFRMEKSREPEDMRRLVGALVQWLKAPEQSSLRRAFTVWINRVLLPNRMPGVVIEETRDLQEVESMLAERVVEWTEQWKQEGLQQGLQQGIQQGIQQGMQQGMQQGVLQGGAMMLLRQFEVKFGSQLTLADRRRIKEADPALMQVWSERILSASCIEDVFTS